MAALTDTQLLEKTREAIDALTTGGVRQYGLNGRTVTKLDLPALWDQVGRLERRISRTGRRMVSVASMRGVS